jgi:hypothetical protein
MHVPRRPPSVGFMAQLTNCRPLGFEAKPRKPSPPVLRPNRKKPYHQFWGQIGRNRPSGFDAKPLTKRRPWFEAQPRNPRSSSPCTQYKPHTASPDLQIIRLPSTRPVLGHPRSSAPGLLLLPRSLSLPVMPQFPPAHHETSKRDYPLPPKDKGKTIEIIPDSNSSLAK